MEEEDLLIRDEKGLRFPDLFFLSIGNQ